MHCEVATVVVRGGPEYVQPGDPFVWTCYVVRCGIDTGYVLAMLGTPTIAEFRQAKHELRALGFRRLEYTRVSGRQGHLDIA